MKKLLVLLFILTGCDEENLYPISDCNQPCVITETGELLVREEAQDYTCNAGTLLCLDTIECVGYHLKSLEECNGRDDDCNGLVDEGLTRGWAQPTNTCSSAPGICAYSNQVCIDGEYHCVPPEGYGVEKCDRIDNNCDGLIDNDIQFEEPLFGYDGPIQTINVGTCRGWVRKCVEGFEKKEGQILPTTEICGNGLDDDCDGFVDENEDNSVEESFLLAIDGSGSMDSWHHMAYLSTFLCGWSQDSRFANSKFAVQLVGINAWKENNVFVSLPSPFQKVLVDFTSPENACQALLSMQGNYIGGGYEYFPQIILDSHSNDNLNWPPELDKNIIVFSDEEPWSLPIDGSPLALSTWQNQAVIQDCVENNYLIGVFTTHYLHDAWNEIALPCGGWVETLYTNEMLMLDTLNQRFSGKC